MARSATTPAIALSHPKKKSQDTACALHSRAVATSGVCRNTSEKEMPLPPEEDSDKEISSSPENSGCFKGLHKRIRGLACQDSVAT